jgi:two-component system chemotaxis response regulator CheB
VVVIGASAGGLEALMRIVRDLPAHLHAALFVAMHVSPRAESRLPELLSKIGPYPCEHVADSEPISEAKVYIARPDRHLLIADGRVFSSDAPRENHHRPSIDALFRSAAIAYGPRTIAVVLSGTLTDGTAGLRWVKLNGGCAIVQDPEEAVFAGMPTSAIANVQVDRVLRADRIAAGIVELLSANSEAGMRANDAIDAQGAPLYAEREPSGLICPDCGGALFEGEGNETMRFRCRVGHAYSPEALHDEQTRNLEEALWTAVRAFEEHAELSARLAHRAEAANLPRISEHYRESERDALAKAQLVRRAISPPAGELAIE